MLKEISAGKEDLLDVIESFMEELCGLMCSVLLMNIWVVVFLWSLGVMSVQGFFLMTSSDLRKVRVCFLEATYCKHECTKMT